MSKTVIHPVRAVLAVLLVGALAGCSILSDDWNGPPECAPVDEGGECFIPSQQGFVAHALASAKAWPQLDGMPLRANTVIEAFDEDAGERAWIVPIESGDLMVAASRFVPAGAQVKLGEVELYVPAREFIRVPEEDERLVLSQQVCGDPLPAECLFTNHAWRIEPLE